VGARRRELVVLEEEKAHLGYATRDLSVLEGRRGDVGG
jgi:hypothetical protein